MKTDGSHALLPSKFAGIAKDDRATDENETPLVVISKLWPHIITHVAEK